MDGPANDDTPPVFIIIGRVRRDSSDEAEEVHVLLTAPDEDSAVRDTLEALAAEGFIEAELDQIGEIFEAPDEEPHGSAYQGALEGEVAVITFGPTN